MFCGTALSNYFLNSNRSCVKLFISFTTRSTPPVWSCWTRWRWVTACLLIGKHCHYWHCDTWFVNWLLFLVAAYLPETTDSFVPLFVFSVPIAVVFFNPVWWGHSCINCLVSFLVLCISYDTYFVSLQKNNQTLFTIICLGIFMRMSVWIILPAAGSAGSVCSYSVRV